MMDGAPIVEAPYPGASATPHQILNLAHAYANTAEHLFEHTKGKPAAVRAPAHLCAIHSIELFLQAFLRFRGIEHAQIRGRQHDLWHDEFALVLGLDTKTSKHLKDIHMKREYLVSRYGPDQFDKLSSPTRVAATLKAIRTKTERIHFSA